MAPERHLHSRASGVHCGDMSKPHSPAQKKRALALGIKVTNQTSRILAAQILDTEEDRSFADFKKMKLAVRTKVTYHGKETVLRHKSLIINRISERGLVFFKGTPHSARPHNLTRV